jgi:hypothetical protein
MGLGAWDLGLRGLTVEFSFINYKASGIGHQALRERFVTCEVTLLEYNF